MKKNIAIELITKHKVLILGYNPCNSDKLRIYAMAKIFKKYIPEMVVLMAKDVARDNDKLMFKDCKIVWMIKDIYGVTVDDHNKNILYIVGNEFAAALYIIK